MTPFQREVCRWTQNHQDSGKISGKRPVSTGSATTLSTRKLNQLWTATGPVALILLNHKPDWSYRELAHARPNMPRLLSRRPVSVSVRCRRDTNPENLPEFCLETIGNPATCLAIMSQLCHARASVRRSLEQCRRLSIPGWPAHDN